MTQSLLGSRKRGRSLGEDESRDFTPLSKRINNLHINANGSCNDSIKEPLKQNIGDPGHSNGVHWNGISDNIANGSHSNGSDEPPSHSHGMVQGNSHNGVQASTPAVQMMGVSVRHDHHQIPAYDPDLGVGENPFYYESNKLLFHLYQERLQRSSHSQY